MSGKPRMLITGMTHNPGGKESFIMASFMALKDEYEISFVSDRESLAHQDVLRQNGAEIIRVRPRSKAPFGYYRDLRSVLRDTSFDVLWCHQSVLNTLAPVTFARRARVPVRIVHSHATKNLGTRVAALLHPVNKRRVASAANRHFACSAEAARWMFGDLPAVIIPNAFNTAAFSFDPHVRSALRSELDIPDQTLVIAHVARFGRRKPPANDRDCPRGAGPRDASPDPSHWRRGSPWPPRGVSSFRAPGGTCPTLGPAL